jgi:hypothetical protein
VLSTWRFVFLSLHIREKMKIAFSGGNNAGKAISLCIVVILRAPEARMEAR